MKLPVADIIEWDVLNWSQLISLWKPIVEALPKGSSILAIGERHGGLTTWLALLGHNVVCTDREFPTEQAQAAHHRLGIAKNITYAGLDIVHCDWQPNSFDLIIGKSVIGGLKADASNRQTRTFEIQQKAINNMYRLLKPGGHLLSAENMIGSQLLQYYRKSKNKDRGWRYLNWIELDNLFERFDLKQVKDFGVAPTNFRSDIVNRACFWANKYLLDALPREYKYISFVAAQKINK